MATFSIKKVKEIERNSVVFEYSSDLGPPQSVTSSAGTATVNGSEIIVDNLVPGEQYTIQIKAKFIIKSEGGYWYQYEIPPDSNAWTSSDKFANLKDANDYYNAHHNAYKKRPTQGDESYPEGEVIDAIEKLESDGTFFYYTKALEEEKWIDADPYTVYMRPLPFHFKKDESPVVSGEKWTIDVGIQELLDNIKSFQGEAKKLLQWHKQTNWQSCPGFTDSEGYISAKQLNEIYSYLGISIDKPFESGDIITAAMFSNLEGAFNK